MAKPKFLTLKRPLMRQDPLCDVGHGDPPVFCQDIENSEPHTDQAMSDDDRNNFEHGGCNYGDGNGHSGDENCGSRDEKDSDDEDNAGEEDQDSHRYVTTVYYKHYF